MSGNNLKKVAFTLLTVCCMVVTAAVGEKISPVSEDELIVRALLHEESRQFAKSQDIFLKLYRETGKTEYLIRAARNAMMPGSNETKVMTNLKKWIETKASPGKDLRPVRMLVALYAKRGRLAEAEPLVDRWLAGSKNPVDLKLAATLKSDLGKYFDAVTLFQKAYEKTHSEKILLQEVTILEKYLMDRAGAISLLETHLRMDPETGVAVYFKLIELYAKEKKIGKVLDLYKKLYLREPQKYVLQKIIKISLYNRDFDGLATFLEKHAEGNEELLYMLYKEQNRFDKAIALAHRRYEQTHLPKWLAEKAILLYEKARNERQVTPAVLKRFQELFEKALKEGADDSLYLNYYGYTLIDHDLDVKRGLALVRQALRQQPQNGYYLDSLAWGLYKTRQCREAFRVMQEVIEKEGMSEPEIKMHWKHIRDCMEKKGIH